MPAGDETYLLIFIIRAIASAGLIMDYFKEIYSFSNLYRAHLKARLGKQNQKCVINFECDLSNNLINLSNEIKNHTYKIRKYYSFKVYDPKVREINALFYKDRVVQHSLCDNVLSKLLEPLLIYDNSACRVNKGNRFALNRLTRFLSKYYYSNKNKGYFLKCDISKFFDNIDHDILKKLLTSYIKDLNVFNLLVQIIDSYEKTPNKGLPLGNQTSQWFAILYLNGLDRLVKEKCRVKFYTRYMDDFVLISNDKEKLKGVLNKISIYLKDSLKLELNSKTKISMLKNGISYLGWHIYLNKNGKIIKKISCRTKRKFIKVIKTLNKNKSLNRNEKQVISSYYGYLKYGSTNSLISKSYFFKKM